MSKQSKDTGPELEVLIAQALSNDRASSKELSAIVAQTMNALAGAEITAQSARDQALDLTLSPDAAKAEQAAWSAQVRLDRWRTALAELQQRYDEVRRAEQAAQRQADYEEVKRRRDALAREFIEVYPEFVSRFIDFAQRTAAVDNECDRFNSGHPQASTGACWGLSLPPATLKALVAVSRRSWRRFGFRIWRRVTGWRGRRRSRR
jgi:hypothetical protein